MSRGVCCIKLRVPRGRSAAPFDRRDPGDTGESGLLIVSSRLGCIRVAVMRRRGRAEEVRGSKMANAQHYSETMNIYNQSG